MIPLAIITLATYGGQRSIDVEVEIPGFTQKYRQSYTITSNVKQLFIKPPLVTGDIDLSAAKSAQVNVTLYEKDGTQITTQSNPVTIKAKMMWNGTAVTSAFLHRIIFCVS